MPQTRANQDAPASPYQDLPLRILFLHDARPISLVQFLAGGKVDFDRPERPGEPAAAPSSGLEEPGTLPCSLGHLPGLLP